MFDLLSFITGFLLVYIGINIGQLIELRRQERELQEAIDRERGRRLAKLWKRFGQNL